MLLLGAGASYGSIDSKGQEVLMGEGLSKLLCENIDIPYQEGKLGRVYSLAQSELGARLQSLLDERFRGVEPSAALIGLASYVWARVYTLNIDDATERAFNKVSPQKAYVRCGMDPWVEADSFYNRLDIVKLNGCVARPREGYIFSPAEYGDAANSPSEWYRQLGRDYVNYVFVFIGTRLEEPLLAQQLEYFANAWKGAGVPGKAYLVAPGVDGVDRRYMEKSGINCLDVTLGEFVAWLDKEIGRGVNPLDVARRRNPEVALVEGNGSAIRSFDQIVKVRGISRAAENLGRTREFYRGFKPTWDEIYDGVPADLGFHAELRSALCHGSAINILYGPAGCGKTTALMMLAVNLVRNGSTAYFLREPISEFAKVIARLDSVNAAPYYFFVEKASSVLDGILDVLKSSAPTKAIFVCGERSNVWKHRTEWVLANFEPKLIHVNDISKQDADRILVKLEKFGPWNRLAKMKPGERSNDLYKKSKRQLLIGLTELTTGDGYEKIIEDDFNSLPSDSAKVFVTLVGLATVHDILLSKDLCMAALESIGIRDHIDQLLTAAHGVVSLDRGKLRVRHPVYVDRLFDGRVEIEIKDKAIRGLLDAMTRNERPISKSMPKAELVLFKFVINHNFIRNYYHGISSSILGLFSDYEKFFEQEGLFYLQYGLVLREFGDQVEALRRLKMAVDSWSMKQTEHAYAQQLLICALYGSKELAFRNLSEAAGLLKRLDKDFGVIDTDYPIVTLAEHHVKILKAFDPSSVAEVANSYIRDIEHRIRSGRTNPRLMKAKEAIIRMAFNGGENNGQGVRRRKKRAGKR